MVLYLVEWLHDNKLAKGKGRSTNDSSCACTCICRNSSDALRCFEWHFRHGFDENRHGFTIDDGVIRMRRMIVDSRNFTAMYLMLDGMREPVYLSDPGSNVLRAHHIFGR